MAIYWHPILAQLLRQVYGDRLEIQEEVNLGEMPWRIDLVIIRRDPAVTLPYPLDHLGTTTLLSFKGPEDTAGQPDLRQLEIYALLYQHKFNLPWRRDLTLWLVASKLAKDVSQRGGTLVARARAAGPGVRAGYLDGFPTCLVNLNKLPVQEATWPLVMVSRGPAERQLAAYFLGHQPELGKYWRQFVELHAKAFLEVITMQEHSLEQAGIDDVPHYVEMLVKAVGGEERLLSFLGEERVVRALGEERVVRALIQRLGVDRARQLLQQWTEEGSPSTEPPEQD